MRIVHISQYNYETMQLAKPILDPYKRVLLAAGRHIHPKYMHRLEAMNITYLFIEDVISRGIHLEEMLDMPSWIDAIEVMQNCFMQIQRSEKMNVIPLQKLAGKLIDEVRKRPVLVLIPALTNPKELQLYAHSVNVALLSVQIGKKLQLNQLQLKELVIGSLLHDIGRLRTDKEHLQPEVGFELMRRNREFSILSAHTVFQHREALNGEGFPRGVKGDQFHLYGQICGISNLYEDMVTDLGIPPHEAMERIMAKSGILYDTTVVRALVQGIPSYPPGTKIELSTKEHAIVVRLESHMQRPRIRMIPSSNEISLEEHPTLMINGLVHDPIAQ